MRSGKEVLMDTGLRQSVDIMELQAAPFGQGALQAH